MADVEHRDLDGADLHEPKDVATAASDTVYAADGAGSGNWVTVAYLLGSTTINAVSGQSSDGEALPLPPGFTFAQCVYIVSVAYLEVNNVARYTCEVDGTGTINATADLTEGGVQGLNVNYLTIGVG